MARGAFQEEPPRERPESPPESYGVPQAGGTFVEWSTVVERLRSATAYWLATVNAAGRPHVVPIWGVLVGGDLYLETGAPGTTKNRNLASNPNVFVHLDNADDAVMVRGRAAAVRPDTDLGGELAAAFAAKYANYGPSPHAWDEGGLIRIDPDTVLAWRDMPTATRWRITARRNGALD
jgi:nitroimidazol reductase NimA-like FMN-containing flavoprotein (pyridoxamine 5'-phosphate oxidase superfamily)